MHIATSFDALPPQPHCRHHLADPTSPIMPILYAVVARSTSVLAEFSATSGNVAQIAMRVLEKTGGGDSRVSYSHDRHQFHLLVSSSIIYLCMADESFGRRIPFAFLEDLRNRFEESYAREAQTAIAYAFNGTFSSVIQTQMEYFNTNPDADVINKVRGGIADVKKGMVENIDKVLDRGEKIDLLVDKADNLQADAFRFKKTAVKLKRAYWWQNVKIQLTVFFVLAAIIYTILAISCGIKVNKC